MEPSLTEAVFSCKPPACTHAGAQHAHVRAQARLMHENGSDDDDGDAVDERETFIARDPSPPAHMLKKLRLFAGFPWANRRSESTSPPPAIVPGVQAERKKNVETEKPYDAPLYHG